MKEDKFYNKNDKVSGYSIIKFIGQGRYGIVYLAENESGQKVVIKQLKKEMLKRSRRKLIYEEKLLKKLNSNKFPNFISRFKDNGREGYILEYIEGKVFEDILVNGNNRFNLDEIIEICNKLLDIVDILYEHNIVHRDIRPPNIIVRDNNELALIDFGLARFVDDINEKQLDYWYIGDFLIHLYYSNYTPSNNDEKPWFEELDLSYDEEIFIKRLMSIEQSFENTNEIRQELQKLKNKI